MTNPIAFAQPLSPAATTAHRTWKIGAGLVGLVLAATAGALAMRSVDHAPSTASSGVPSERGTASALAIPSAQRPAPVPRVGLSNPAAQDRPEAEPARVAVCAACGVVQSVRSVQERGAGTGAGAVAGGLLGGVIGHQMGGGNGRTAMTVLGAIGGGLAGNEVEKRARSRTAFEVTVRMEDGSVRTFHRTQPLAVGAEVVSEGTTVHLRRDAAVSEAPRTLRTSTSGI